MDEKIELRFKRHALHQKEAGSWFVPKNPRIGGHQIFIYDSSIQNMSQRVQLATRVTHITEGCYKLPVDQLGKAERERQNWLKQRFITVANRLHREARACPDEDYRFHSLHPKDGEWLARYMQRSSGDFHDYRLDELKEHIRGTEGNHFESLLNCPLEKPALSFPDAELCKGIKELTAIGPKIRTRSDLYTPAYSRG